ncbi:hypothetical protein CONPUDRAFT_163376 [Coniophora puteana RWD-64-598 SS2]|uniref:RRM domain-containing protein n=1 Tax=Coniophora puteana (strain RWD-64-598) TaxID=741705 RepID=A0A5M3MYT3_CONPW|nr:uncharacterized protein CONPUDRAFT_163376 [Coniophora puteana RWD-64-598 SS2]EIW84187.1 hypothetical protein CONPUDRAFT_163376 [Coniophora puteana RWD-64-598 SS2]
MAPKKQKAQKISLNEFLGDNALGSWADEMDSLPTAPAARNDDDDRSRQGDRFSRRDDYGARGDRPFAPPREDLPLPTNPPFTAFVGNLAFDITESELESFFAPHQTKSIKIIKDRDDKPKGFGYVEFAELDGLKDAISKSASPLSGRTVRVSVAEPPKERSGFSGGGDDDEKFSGNWRRDGPPPVGSMDRDGPPRRRDGPAPERAPPAVSDEVSAWRSSKPRMPEPEPPAVKRRGSGFATSDGPPGAADAAESWSMGSKFKPNAGQEEMGPPRSRGRFDSTVSVTAPPDEGEWRRAKPAARNSTSPNSSTPPTPQLNRRKLELLPRSSTNTSASPSPLSSPKMANSPAATTNARANPFGAAKPVDVSGKEKEVAERIEKERAPHAMSRTDSRQGTDRPPHSMSRTGSRQASDRPPASTTPATAPPASGSGNKAQAATATIRPSFSFANAAAAKRAAEESAAKESRDAADNVADRVAEVSV